MSWALNRVILSPYEASVFRRETLPTCDDVTVEIGFGNGEFLLDMASRNERGFCFGIEVSMTSILKAARKCLMRRLPNVRLLCGDGSFLLREFFLPESVGRVYVNFPCPWPKKRHAKRRLVTPGFVCNLAHALKVKGAFELASDERWYIEDARTCLLENPAFEVGDVLVGESSSFRTKYEEKWISMGKSIYRLKATKHVPFSLYIDLPMDIHFSSYLVLKELLSPTKTSPTSKAGFSRRHVRASSIYQRSSLASSKAPLTFSA